MKNKVTILCTAYNHEKYIRRTLEGFVNQQTNFPYIVIVHDDASTDNTASIIREFEQRYPDKIKGIYQSENQYSKGVKITADILSWYVDSDYVALCEGDDYWIDNSKLQKQYDALNSNTSCFMCVHKVVGVCSEGHPNGHLFPKISLSAGVVKGADFVNMSKDCHFQTSSYFFKTAKWKDFMQNPPKFKQISKIGDAPLILYFGHIGDVYYIDTEMSCYREGVEGSWSVTVGQPQNFAKYTNHLKQMIDMFEAYNEYTEDRFCAAIDIRISNLLFSFLILTKSAKEMFCGHNKKYFLVLSMAKRMYVLFASMFPKLAKKLYFERMVEKIK